MIYEFEGYLVHHGIKGQKWGVKNGPPYPLSEGKKSRWETRRRKRVAKSYQNELNAKYRRLRELDRDTKFNKQSLAEDEDIIEYNKKAIAKKRSEGKSAKYRETVTRWTEESRDETIRELKAAKEEKVAIKEQISSIEKYLKDNGYSISVTKKVVPVTPLTRKEGLRGFIDAGLFGPGYVDYETVDHRKVRS